MKFFIRCKCGMKISSESVIYCYLCGKIPTMKEKLILVTNDDGYDSGLAAAVEVARAFGRVVVVAPERRRDGMA